MPKMNPIRRGLLDQETVFAAWSGVHLPGCRVWYATCPVCSETVMHRLGLYNSRATRKNTKDALYRHQQQHKPGLVGR